MPRRRLNRESEIVDSKGKVKSDLVRTWQVNKRQFQPNQLKNDIKNQTREAKQKLEYQRLISNMRLRIKRTDTIEELVNTMLKLNLNGRMIVSIFNEVSKKGVVSKSKFKDQLVKKEKILKRFVTDTKNSNESKTLPPKKPGQGNLLNGIFQETFHIKGHKLLMSCSQKFTIWVLPVCEHDVNKTFFDAVDATDFLKFQKSFLNLINAINDVILKIDPKKQQSRLNPDYHQSQNIYVALDCEWVMSKIINKNVLERDLDDVLSFQLSAWSPDTKKRNDMIIYNTTGEHFQFSELLRGILHCVSKVAYVNEDGTLPKHFKITLLTYFGGVDVSCFAGFETRLHDLRVLHKNFIFSDRPLVFDVRGDGVYSSVPSRDSTPTNDFTLSLKFVDTGLIAPSGGLSALGDAVGSPKIDTEKYDRQDHLKIGYYKSHMDTFLRRRPSNYRCYALLDAQITLDYYLKSLQVFPSWASKPPATIGSFGASEVYNLAKTSDDYKKEFCFRDNLNKADISNSSGVEAVKKGQADLFMASIHAYYGGFNTAFLSGYLKGYLVDLDLTSAYNVAGLLLPVVNWDNSNYEIVDDNDLSTKIFKTPIHLTSNNSFETIYNVMQSNPFYAGVLTAKVKLPRGTKMSTIPFHSKIKNAGPCYVLSGQTDLTLIDAYNAMRMGGTVEIIDGYIPQQDHSRLSACGTIQSKYLSLRNEAKAKMKQCIKGSKDYDMYNFQQLLFKLISNAIYGKTGQGTSLSKKSRNFDTNETESISYNSITNPLLASTYTGITRYLISLLYDAVTSTCKNAIPLNITTDGMAFTLPDQSEFTESLIRKAFLDQLPQYYTDRCKLNFDTVTGFEVKGAVYDSVFNLKTRVNGTLNYDDTNGGISALASMRGKTNAEIFDLIKNDHINVVNDEFRGTNITEMKHHIKNHLGHQEVWEQQKVVNLQYDCAYQPTPSYVKNRISRYFKAVPFPSVAEHDRFKSLSHQLGRVFNFSHDLENYNAYLKTLSQPHLKVRDRDLTDEELLKYSCKNWCCQHISDKPKSELYKVAQSYGISKSGLANYLKRHTVVQGNINYLASYYFNQQLDA